MTSTTPAGKPAEQPLQPLTKQQKAHETVLATACGGMSIALGTVLSMIKLYEMPQGGSITPASLLPIIFCAMAFGPVWGIGIGAVYGLLQFIIWPYPAHWASVILDYPLAFALLGLAGLFAAPLRRRIAEKNILHRLSLIPFPLVVIGIFVGAIGRFASSFLSGVIFYGSYAAVGQSVWAYSLVYNGSYLLPDLAILIVVFIPLAAVIRPRKREA